MKFFEFTAEHMNSSKLKDVMQTLEDNGLGCVVAAGMHDVLVGFARIIVDCNAANSRKIQALVHEHNGGNMCSVEQVRRDEIEEYL